MRLLNYGPVGGECPGILSADGRWITPISTIDATLPRTMRGLLAGGHLARLIKHSTATSGITNSNAVIASENVRFAPPITDPGKIIGVGLNYRGHATEQNKPWPEQPMLFSKPTTALVGAHDQVILPAEDCGPDYEVELVVVIGRRGRSISTSAAFEHVAGYCIGNDISGRRWQKSDVQYFRAKGCDTFFPCGPFIVTADEVPDPKQLRLTTTLDGVVMQDALVADLIHDIPTLISYISRYMTLEPGDLISTGTPAGVGCYRSPPRFLRPGDVVTCAISGAVHLGQLKNNVVAARE